RQGAWYFAEPEQDRVDATLALALLDRLNHLGIVEDLGAGGQKPDPVPLGVEGDRAIRVSLSGAGGEGSKPVKETIVLGIDAPRSGSVYARREGADPGLFVVDGNPRPWLESPLEVMRDRKLLAAPANAVVQIVLRQSSGEIALQRRITPPVQEWALASPLVSWADREAMDALLTAIASLQIEEVIKDGKPGGAIPNPLPPEAAVLQFQIYGIEQPLTLFLQTIGEAENGLPVLEARASDRPYAYRLTSNFLKSLPDSPNALRDRTLARIPHGFLEAVQIQSRIDPLVDLRAERNGPSVSWKVVLGNKLVPANASEVNDLVSAVNEAAIQRFVSDSATDLASFGLVPPQRRLVFNLKFPGQVQSDGTEGEARELTRVLDLGWKEGEEGRLYANFEGEPYVYELDPTFLNLIPTHPVKWKSLNVLTFNPMHLKSITREKADKENLKLDYNYRTDAWSASRSGLDVSPSLDIVSARRLRDRLGSLTATDWYLTLGPAIEALQEPGVTFTIVTVELDRAKNEPVETTRRIRFAPATTNLYYGQLEVVSEFAEGSPDVFLIDRDTYGDLIRDVTTARVPVP
ncbi:MAG: DUF4340 domain-containing protein, partial [Verrucomicrobiae bacterium]|nr:DUF4340 domain-containing protein [Verrucomicrobiae bacterium]